MTGSSARQAGAPRWTLGVTSMAAFMAGMDALPAIHAGRGAATVRGRARGGFHSRRVRSTPVCIGRANSPRAVSGLLAR